MPNCIYKNKCASKGVKCSQCKHNQSNKEDHFEPINSWLPWIHYYQPPHYQSPYYQPPHYKTKSKLHDNR
jgi:hypothetical protein